MATIRVSSEPATFQYIVVLIDYNPHSTLFDEAQHALAVLPFVGQVKLLRTGFALWQQSFQPVSDGSHS